MSMVTKLARLAIARPGLLALTKAIAIPSRNCGWTRDWKPGPPPKTKEEREAAAKKYNLIPEDYEPYPEGAGWGDYPKIPRVGQDARDPYEDFDYHYRRRNFGETLHYDYDALTSDRHDPNEKYRYSPLMMLSSFFGFVFGLGAIVYVFNYFDIRICQPVKPKQYPGPGKIHYTFEPLDQ
jgi:NADH dehydrogenase (ubiquinone) 1 beta subcomplex subunit 8